MNEENSITSALNAYFGNWHRLVSTRNHKAFFESMKPVAVGWKVEDRAAYNEMLAEFHDQADRVIETWMNGRWIAKVHLAASPLPGGIEIIKIMQRRPESTDAVGLDHVDFYIPEKVNLAEMLAGEDDLKWSEESNDVIDNYNWVSLWFDGTEAKLKFDTVLDIIQAELREINEKITAV